MCFSASASFGAGVVLSAVGIATVKKVQMPSLYPFAVIPLIFAAQQFSEGFLWLALSDSDYAFSGKFFMYSFLFFAQVVWPVWVPFSVLKMEEQKKNRSIQKLLVWMGVIVSAYLAYCLVTYPVSAGIQGLHISYKQDYPEALRLYGGALYLTATIVPLLSSSIRGTWLPGTAILISYLLTLLFYNEYVVSVWCFFAALISLMILAVIYGVSKSTVEKAGLKTD